MRCIKSFISILLCLLLSMLTLAGCGAAPREEAKPEPGGEKRLSIVATIFPAYDWVREIAGEKLDEIELTLLLDDGVDLHSYQPTVTDMVKISSCDLFLYTGGSSDNWVKDALAEAANPNIAAINLIDALGGAVVEEEVVEGMQEEDEDEPEYDEHVWLSLRNALWLCEEIAAQMGSIDEENREIYAANAAAYQEKLIALDQQYTEAVRGGRVKTLLFGDRFPFRYLTDDYALHYYAAFSGCSAETEASFETIVFLANKVDELGLNAVMTIETSDGKIAQTIVENTSRKDARILKMDSLQSTTAEDVAKGATYLGAMEHNLEVLRQAIA